MISELIDPFRILPLSFTVLQPSVVKALDSLHLEQLKEGCGSSGAKTVSQRKFSPISRRRPNFRCSYERRLLLCPLEM